MIPKFTALARARCSSVTASGAMPATSAAVRRWMSAPVRKASHEALVARVVGEDAELDLRVVRREQPVALGGHEGLADAHAALAADRDVLHVRDATTRAARWPRRSGGRSDGCARARVHEGRQRVDVGAAQLREPALREHVGRQLVLARRAARARSRRSSSRSSSSSRRAAGASRRGSPGAASASRSGSARRRARRCGPRAARARRRTPWRGARGPPRRCARPRAPSPRAPR